jgi:hypothetical protein
MMVTDPVIMASHIVVPSISELVALIPDAPSHLTEREKATEEERERERERENYKNFANLSSNTWIKFSSALDFAHPEEESCVLNRIPPESFTKGQG